MHTTCPDLVVLSHLRWVWVWQRPQHIVSRLAARRAATGARTFFVEEPVAVDGLACPQIRAEQLGDVTRMWLEVPAVEGQPEFMGFQQPEASSYGELLADWLAENAQPGPDVWVYTPMAYDIASALSGGRLVYDVMDDLASFRNAPEGLRLRQRRLLGSADVVFTGGRSLHRLISAQRRSGAHLFPSGVESAHYASSRSLRVPHDRPVVGYVGVIDERLDLDLIASLAKRLPEWDVQIVGPVAKIEPASLPSAPNISYAGFVTYDRLPEVMAGFDVAMMPFAINEATQAISPTKTLEYLAAGLPVVSTRVPDVVADYGSVVHLADDAAQFAAACREVFEHSTTDRDRQMRPLLRRQEWDAIVAEMSQLLDQRAPAGVTEVSA